MQDGQTHQNLLIQRVGNHGKAHFRELVEPKVREHRGQIVKNTGDGLLAEFPSVVDAGALRR
jgi:class 3 adenylate cyclase